jgi:hypothetical protein
MAPDLLEFPQARGEHATAKAGAQQLKSAIFLSLR